MRNIGNRSKMWALVVATLLVSLSVSTSQADPDTDTDPVTDPVTDPNEHASELLLLLGYIDIRLDQESLERVGVGEDGAELRAVAIDTDLSTYTRSRAVHGLGFYQNDANLSQLVELVRSDSNTEVRVSAIFVLSVEARIEAASAVDDALMGLLVESDEQIIGAVIRASGRLPAHRGQPLIERLTLLPELTPYLQEMLAEQLSRGVEVR